MSLNVKIGDTVLVIAGKDKGKSGKVLVSMPADNSVVVAGVNIIARHKKPRSANDKGGIIKKEGKIDASNVQVICPNCGKATRINNVEVDGKKIRQCKKYGANLDAVVKKETKKTATKETTKTTATKKAETKEVKSTAKAVEAKTTTKSTATKAADTKTTTSKSTASKSTAAKSTTKSASAKPAAAKKTTTKKEASK
jgi:large subunit ribosomal protein L24